MCFKVGGRDLRELGNEAAQRGVPCDFEDTFVAERSEGNKVKNSSQGSWVTTQVEETQGQDARGRALLSRLGSTIVSSCLVLTEAQRGGLLTIPVFLLGKPRPRQEVTGKWAG